LATTRATDLWFGKRVTAEPGTELGPNDAGDYGKVSETGRWFSYDWWFGHHMTREGDGTWKDERGFGKRAGGGTYKGRTRAPESAAQRRERAQRDYAGYCHERFQAAEKATAGNMVTPAGRAKGYSGADFFAPDSRQRPGRKWMTEELRGWMGDGDAAGGHHGSRGGILSFTAYEQQSKERAA